MACKQIMFLNIYCYILNERFKIFRFILMIQTFDIVGSLKFFMHYNMLKLGLSIFFYISGTLSNNFLSIYIFEHNNIKLNIILNSKQCTYITSINNNNDIQVNRPLKIINTKSGFRLLLRNIS